MGLCFFNESRALFMRPTSTLFRKKKKNFKTRSYCTIHIFKNYFTITFSAFSKISGIQTDPKCSFGNDLFSFFFFFFLKV